MILDQGIEGRIFPSQPLPLSPIRREFDRTGLATFLNQLDLYTDVIELGESASC